MKAEKKLLFTKVGFMNSNIGLVFKIGDFWTPSRINVKAFLPSVRPPREAEARLVVQTIIRISVDRKSFDRCSPFIQQ